MAATKQKMSLNPPQSRSAEEFVKGAGQIDNGAEQSAAADEQTYPWKDEKVREDVIKSINLRLPEPYILKLQYLSEVTNKSQQALIRDVLLPAIDEHIEKVTGGNEKA